MVRLAMVLDALRVHDHFGLAGVIHALRDWVQAMECVPVSLPFLMLLPVVFSLMASASEER